jgi:hypothetical protein
VQPELELGHDAEVPAAPAQAPEQLPILGLTGAHHGSLGRDELEGTDVVAREPVLPGQPAHPATEREPADTGVRHVARGGGQTMRPRGSVKRAEQGPALHPRALALGVDANATHRRQVDHQPVLGNREAQDRMPATPHPDLKTVLASKPDRDSHVAAARTANDHPRAPVDHGIPNRAGLVIAGVARRQKPAVELLVQLPQDACCTRGTHSVSPPAWWGRPRRIEPARQSDLNRDQDQHPRRDRRELRASAAARRRRGRPVAKP